MTYHTYRISSIKKETADTTILRLQSEEGLLMAFKSGQYCRLRNPLYKQPEEEHIFSIASAPEESSYLEFCIKTYGYWTQAINNIKVGNILEVSDPQGSFILHKNDTNMVFLVGGTGIAPVVSMLRHINGQNLLVKALLLYGSRTPDDIVYGNELDYLQSQKAEIRVVHIMSHLKPEYDWPGYRGFITADIMKKEIDFSAKPVFFMCGPPIFIEKMKALLYSFSVADSQIREEKL